MNTFKASIFIFCFLFLSPSIFSQNKVSDSLINNVKTHKIKDTTKVDLLYKVAFSSFQSDLELTKLYLRKVENLSDSLHYTKGKAKASYLKGILESRKSNYATSLEFFEQSLKYYKSIEDKEGIAAVYSAFGITHFIQSEYEEGLKYYNKATETFKELGDKENLIKSLIFIANVNTETGKYDEAISKYKEALHLSIETNDEESIMSVYSNMGVLYRNLGNYPLAIEYYRKGLEYNEKAGDTLGMAYKLNNLGDAYKSIEKYDTALKYHNQSLNYATIKNNRGLIGTNSGNIGNIYTHKKEYLKALKYHKKALEISQEINDVKQVALCYVNIGEIYQILNQQQTARENFKEAINISEKTSLKRSLSYSLLGIAKTFLVEKQYDKANVYAIKGQKIADELELLDAQKKASEILSTIYQNTGNYRKALESHQQFKTLNDSIFNKENIEKITQIEYDYKYKQALDSASIRELKLTKTVKSVNQNLEKSQRNLFLGIIAFLTLGIVLVGIIFFFKLRHEKSKTQNIAIEQKLLRSQMTPHFIFNSLSVLQGMILNKEDKKSIFYLSKFSKLLRITLENSRDKMVPLHDELEAVNNYLELQNLEENEAYQYTILVDDTIDEDLFKIPPMLIQPFIENAIEHAFENIKEHKKIDILLKFLNKALICTITDNGIGIDAQKKTHNKNKKSLATTITSERIQALSKDFKVKGSVIIEDRKKYNLKGTIVTLVIPYKISDV